MTVPVRRGRWWRWGLVAAGVAVLVSLPAVRRLAGARRRSPRSSSPTGSRPRGASRTRASCSSSGIAGLPSLPQVADVIALLNGETQLRAYYAGPQRWRVDQIGSGTERDLYQTGSGQVLWDFGTNQVTEIVGELPVRLPARRRPGPARPGPAAARPSAPGPVPPPGSPALPARRVAGRRRGRDPDRSGRPGRDGGPHRHLGRPGDRPRRCRSRSPAAARACRCWWPGSST